VVGLLFRLGCGGNEDYGRQVRKIEGADFGEGEEISPRLGEMWPVDIESKEALLSLNLHISLPVSIGKVSEEALQQWQSTCVCIVKVVAKLYWLPSHGIITAEVNQGFFFVGADMAL